MDEALSQNWFYIEEDLLRRSRTALNEVSPFLAGNIIIIQDAFTNAYGTDAAYVFKGLLKDSGVMETTTAK